MHKLVSGLENINFRIYNLKLELFLYIPCKRPLILKDQHIIQLSHEVQILVHILKKDTTEGTIKLQFTKPLNQPFYKASLKEGQTLRIGRSQNSHIKLSQQSVSSKHSEIKYQDKQFRLYDCLSSTGTWLRLSKKGIQSEIYPLQQGDIIRISSKKTYMIQKIKNLINNQQQDDQIKQKEDKYQSIDLLKQDNYDHFNSIIQNAMKRKNPHQKKLFINF